MNIYCFWTGTNDMSENRKRCLSQLKQTSGCNVILVDPSNLQNYILPEHPIHPAFEYLSLTHKADYLRTYFMHFHGGGYSDIKETGGSWIDAFKELYSNDEKWICGYREVPHGVAYPPNRDKWRELIGNGAYICKPQTQLTTEWYSEMIALLDTKLERLKQFPATHPQEQGDSRPDYNGYPMEWNEMLGRIFHKICYKYKERLMNKLPLLSFCNYR